MKKTKIYKCQRCGKNKEDSSLPYLWTVINRKTSEVHDSDIVEYKSTFYICDKCGTEWLLPVLQN